MELDYSLWVQHWVRPYNYFGISTKWNFFFYFIRLLYRSTLYLV